MFKDLEMTHSAVLCCGVRHFFKQELRPAWCCKKAFALLGSMGIGMGRPPVL